MSAIYNQTLSDEQIISGLRNLIGYVENGTDTTLTIMQDDATRTFSCRIGPKTYVHAQSFRECLIEAINKHGDDYLK